MEKEHNKKQKEAAKEERLRKSQEKKSKKDKRGGNTEDPQQQREFSKRQKKIQYYCLSCERSWPEHPEEEEEWLQCDYCEAMCCPAQECMAEIPHHELDCPYKPRSK